MAPKTRIVVFPEEKLHLDPHPPPPEWTSSKGWALRLCLLKAFVFSDRRRRAIGLMEWIQRNSRVKVAPKTRIVVFP